MNYVSTGQRAKWYAKDVNDVARVVNKTRFPLVRGKGESRRHPAIDGADGEFLPWLIHQHEAATPDPTSDWRTFRVRRGLINQVHPDNDAEVTTPLDIVVPASTTEHKVWLKTTYQNLNLKPGLGTQLPTITACTIEHGASWWSGYPTLYDFTGLPNVVRYDAIGTITTGVDSPADDGGDPPVPNPDYHKVTLDQLLDENLTQTMESAMFPVSVSSDGGSDGDATTAASWTYAITSLDGSTSLASGAAQERARPLGKTVAGSTIGQCYWAGDGALKLWDAGEYPDNGLCVDP